MRTRSTTTILATMVIAFVLTARAAEDTMSFEGKPAPEISLKRLDGSSFKLSDMKGDVVVVDFWATWCPPCRRSLPHLSKVTGDKELAEKGLKVFAVDAKETGDKVKTFLETNKLTLNVVMDAEGKSMGDYKVRGIPTTLVIGRDGTVKKAFIGFGGEESEKALDAAIESALKDPKPAK